MGAINVSEDFFRKFGKKFPPESLLAREGDEGSTMFLVNSGKLQVTKNTPTGEKILATLGEGDFFGEMALMGIQKMRSATVKTLLESTVLELNKAAFEGLIRRSPDIAMSIIHSLASRIRDSNAKLAALVHRSDAVRVAAFISQNVIDKGSPAPNPNIGRTATLSLDVMSSTLDVPAQKVLKFLQLSSKARLISIQGEKIWVPHPQYLIPFGEYLAARPDSF